MGNGQARGYIPGDHFIICDYSGFKIRRSEARMTWDGYLVRKDFWEARQPQDFVRGLRDKISVDPGQARGESTDVFIDDGYFSELVDSDELELFSADGKQLTVVAV